MFSVLLAVMCFSFPVLTFATTINIENNEHVVNNDEIAQTNNTIGNPGIDWIIYNTAVTYIWTAGEGADDLAMHISGDLYHKVGSTVFEITEFSDVGFNYQNPMFYRAKSYNSVSGTYSGFTSLECHEHPTMVTYWICSKIAPVAEYASWIFTSQYIPTTYDEQHFRWDHGGNLANTIAGTIEYDGVVVDFSQKITILRPVVKIVISGVTFCIRVGTERVTMKVEQNGVYASSVRMSFGVI